MLSIVHNDITYIQLSYELYTVKKEFVIEINVHYINPVAKEFLNVSADTVEGIDYLLASVGSEYIDMPLKLKVQSPRTAYIHLGMCIDTCNMALEQHLDLQKGQS